MSARVVVAIDDDGTLVAVKGERGRGGSAGLRAEAAAMTTYERGGLAVLRRLEEGPPVRLVAEWVGPRSLADLRHASPTRAAHLTAQVARLVAGLHRDGLVHGRIDPSHVLLDHRGDPVLCSLSDLGPVGAGATSTGGDREPLSDVRATAALLEHLLDRHDAPTSIWERLARPRSARLASVLRALARRASSDGPGAAPSAMALARSIEAIAPLPPSPADEPFQIEATPGEATPGGATPLRPPPARPVRVRATEGLLRTRSRWITRAPILVGAALLVVAFVVRGDPRAQGRADPVTDVEAAAPERSHPGTQPSQPATDGPPSTVPAEVSSSGSATEHQAPLVDLGGLRYLVGEPGDGAAVADWRCEGTQSVALIRPSTGSTFLFSEPPAPGSQVEVTPLAKVPVGSSIVEPSPGASCPALTVRSPGGELHVLPITREAR